MKMVKLAVLAVLGLATPFAGLAAIARETRIYYLGNSLTDELKYDAFVKLAEAGGEKVAWGRHMIPGVPIRGLWGAAGGFMQPPYGHWQKALREYEWDAVTLQPFCPFEGEYQHAVLFVREIVKRSPDAQVFIYAQWPGKGRGADWFDAFAGPRETPGYLKNAAPEFRFANVLASLEPGEAARLKGRSLRDEYEAIVLGLRKSAIARKPAKLIPVGHVMQLLGQKMRAGLVPGYRTPWDFYSDGVHVNNDGSYLVALVFYATVFGKSPLGLPVGPYQGRPGFTADAVRITPELARMFQQTAWEVVATHRLTGVSSDDPLAIATPRLEPAVAGEPYRFEVLPSFGKAPHTWKLTGGALPDGLALSADGVLAGLATKEGKSRLSLQVTDAKGASAQKDLELLVERDMPPTIPPQSIPRQAVGVFFQHHPKSDGGNGAHRWRVKQDERLPFGLSLDPDGRLWGAPGKEGSFRFSLVVEDGDPAKPEAAEEAFSLEVGPPAGEVAFARRLAEKPKFDPEPDPAQWSFRYPIRKLVQGEQATVEGDFDLAWDDEHLWVAVRIKDATLNKGTWSDALAADNAILCLDMFSNREATYNADDRYIVYPRGHLYPQRSITIGDEFSFGCRQKEIEGGYLALFRVNFRNFRLAPESLPFRTIGLEIMLVDNAVKGVPASMVVWRGTRDNAMDPSKFGTVVLAE